jgi:hypothetical protein
MLESLGDYNLIGVPQNYTVSVNSGAGGNVVCDLVVPAGRIWLVKYLTAYHTDAGGGRTIVWQFKDAIRATNIQGPYSAPAANIRYPLPMGTEGIIGPLVVSPGCFNVGVICQAMGAGTTIVLEAHVHCFYGVAPLG